MFGLSYCLELTETSRLKLVDYSRDDVALGAIQQLAQVLASFCLNGFGAAV